MKRTSLKRHTKLKASKGLRLMSDKAKAELKVWGKVVKERKQKLLDKYGFIPCEYCHKYCSNGVGHHLDRNRRNNILINCLVVHVTCHTEIHDNNVKDVPSML